MGRDVTLVLIDAEGSLLGMLPSLAVPEPWWQLVASVVSAARERFGLELTVLRLLAAERASPPSGAVTYLAELEHGALASRAELLVPVPASLAELALRREPLRSSWASPGGPARSVAWARSQLAELGHVHVRTEQQRSWNLSATWRLESRDPAGHPASTWLKEVPPFFAHEAAVLRWLAEHVPGVAVPLIAADGQGRALLEHVEGEDAYGCGAAERDRFAALLHRIQTTSQGHVDALLARGLPDRRGAALMAYMRRALAAHVPDSSIVAGLLDDLPERFAALHACGIADSLVHGDFHPGNVRAGRDRAIVIDWGDSFIGHPALDLLRLTDGCTELEERTLIQSWSQRWRNGSPASEPERAVELLRPVTALRHAALFADICARIEPSERPYHVCDIPRCLQDAANSWRASPTL